MIVSTEGELWKEMDVKVNFCDTANLTKTNDIYYKDDNKNYVFTNKLKESVEKAINNITIILLVKVVKH